MGKHSETWYYVRKHPTYAEIIEHTENDGYLAIRKGLQPRDVVVAIDSLPSSERIPIENELRAAGYMVQPPHHKILSLDDFL
jgi:hypothetical protein